MGKRYYKGSKLYLDGYEMNVDLNRVNLKHGAKNAVVTPWGGSTEIYLPGGQETVALSLGGYYDPADDAGWHIPEGKFSAANKVFTICPTTGAVAERAMSMKGIIGNMVTGGKSGDLAPFALEAAAGSELLHGTVLHTGTEDTTGNGASQELGAIATGKKLYGVLHVLEVSGTNPTLDVLIKSDDATGFPSGTTRITFAQASAVGSEWATPIAGPITDDWWRAYFTIGGTETPTFKVAIVWATK